MSPIILASTPKDAMPQKSTVEPVGQASTSIIIPSPFKRALFWPTPKDNIKKRKKEKVPAVISSIEWQKYHEDKEKKKAELEEQKIRKAEERRKKKEQNEEFKKKAASKIAKKKQKLLLKRNKKTDLYNDTSSEEEWVESGDSLDDLSEEHQDSEEEIENVNMEKENCNAIKQGDYVLVKFPGKKSFTIMYVLSKSSLEKM